ncbi:DNA helicase MCM8-like [Anopheles maculipalpis]|uniref:DNA helicase MCM8-like n=1 Tax=Anopheles maculipalpis TaxID=1496333 RepID=UPI0021594630|nr:DNA helicase MCM8-like [Anopheles maculipalpis]
MFLLLSSDGFVRLPTLILFGMASIAMDEQDVFETTFPDWECNITENYTPSQEDYYLPQSSWLFEEDQTIPNNKEQNSLDRIGWQLYFPNKDMQVSRTIIKHIRSLEKHYQDFRHDYPLSEVEHCRSFEFKLQLAKNDPILKDTWPTLENDLKDYPEYTLACIGLAMYRSVVAYCTARRFCSSTTKIPKIYPRLDYFGTVKSIGTINSSCAGKLVTVRGIIRRVSQHYVNASSSTYTCKYCVDKRVFSQPYEIGTKRQRTCSNCLAEGELLKRKENQRCIMVQEMAFSLDVKVPDEIAPSLVPGADVLVTGIVNVDMSKMYLQAVCVHTNSTGPFLGGHDFEVKPKLKATDLRAIKEIQSEPLPLKLLVQSLYPNMKGMVTIKAGLLLALFNTSWDTHVLLTSSDNDIMRPLLKCCQFASPKAVLWNNSFQKTDLALKRSQDGLDYLAAGPSVANDYGLCCVERIDELDSLETMEKILIYGSNNVKVHKGTTLLATASPSQGIFDARKPFLDNFTIPRAIIERFALVFRMEDTIDPEEDLVCFNGVRLHPETPSETKCSVEIPLVRMLKLQPGEYFDPLPIELLRKYIDYARHHCNPEFTEESTKLLESFFSQMYSMPQWLNITNGMKMTQIQNMVRARARIDLAAEISVQHVMDTIRIVSRSWYDKYDTDDRDPVVKLPKKMGSVKATTIRKFLDVLRSKSVQLKCKLFTMKDLRQLMHEIGMSGVEDEIVERLNIQGYLLKKSSGCYELFV